MCPLLLSHIIECCVVRDRETGISRGFAFLTFLDESEAEAAVNCENHTLDGKPIRVSLATKNPTGTKATAGVGSSHKKGFDFSSIFDSISLPRLQTKVYIGPVDDDVNNGDIVGQLEQYGVIRGVSKLKASKKSYALVEYKDPISVRRTFTNKIFIKGKHIRTALSKLAIELVLSRSVVFFYEAHEYCKKAKLEAHFAQYGSVFRAFHFMEEDFQNYKSYGFVDFVGEDSVPRAITAKQQLIQNQFVRVSKFLPSHLIYDLLAVSDKHANAMIKKMEQAVPDQGMWGSQAFKGDANDQSTSQVRIPASLVPKLIGKKLCTCKVYVVWGFSIVLIFCFIIFRRKRQNDK